MKKSKWTGAFKVKPKIGTGGTVGLSKPAADGVQGVRSVDKLQRERYLQALRGNAPSGWVSDHLREDLSLKGAVYVAIKVLADQAAMATRSVYKWHPEAKAADDTNAKLPVGMDHDLLRLLNKPNPTETWGILARRMVQQLCLTGSFLGWRVDDGWDMPSELWAVPTGTYQPVPPSIVYPRGAYRIQPFFPGPLAMIPGAWNAGGCIVPTEHMLVMRHPHPLVQWEGLSPLTACDLAVDTINSIDRARMSMTRRMITPSMICELDPEVAFPDDAGLQRLILQLQQIYGGPDKAGGSMVLEPGMTARPWTPGADGHQEVGWVESWNQLIGFVMAVFGVTKSVGFMNEDSSYAQLYASLKQFNLLSLCPLLGMMADYINLQLVWPFWGEDHFVELTPEKIDDGELHLKKIDTLMKGKAITRNELRIALEYPPTEEKWGAEQVDGGQQQQPGQQGNNPLAAALDDGQRQEQGGEREQAPEVEETRPDNEQGEHSQGPQLERRSRFGKHLPPAQRRQGWKTKRLALMNGKAMLNGKVLLNGKH